VEAAGGGQGRDVCTSVGMCIGMCVYAHPAAPKPLGTHGGGG